MNVLHLVKASCQMLSVIMCLARINSDVGHLKMKIERKEDLGPGAECCGTDLGDRRSMRSCLDFEKRTGFSNPRWRILSSTKPHNE